MKAKELKTKSPKELHKLLDDSRSKLANLRVEYKTTQVKNIMQIKYIKKDIARILTIISQQSQGESK